MRAEASPVEIANEREWMAARQQEEKLIRATQVRRGAGKQILEVKGRER